MVEGKDLDWYLRIRIFRHSLVKCGIFVDGDYGNFGVKGRVRNFEGLG